MPKILIYGMIYLGSILMVYNIYCFVRFAQYIKNKEGWGNKIKFLYIPIILLILFLLGYLAVGFFGKPDLVIAGILFGGSIFVTVIYQLLSNITKEVIRNERLRAELIASEQSSQAKSAFLASISHEMRTPMNVILGLSEITLHNDTLQADIRRTFEKIVYSGRHLLGLINNILDMNQIETGDLIVREDPFVLSELLAQIIAIVQTLCEDKGLSFQAQISEEAEGSYQGDMMLLKQVLLEILDNAVKYTEAPGSVHFRVNRLSCEGSRSMLRFDIEDTGIGMAPEFIKNVFDRFAREDASSTNRYTGVGIGLAAVKSKTELMGGTIEVSSEKDVGSLFTVTLPLVILPEKEQEAEPLITLENCRILIVEDMAANAEVVADLLELEGADTEHAENGQIALEMFQASAPDYYDAILMDLRMPVMDGLEASRRIRSLNRPDAINVPILALTANAFETDIQQSLDAGMNVHLSKPIDTQKLYTALKKFISEARKRKAQGALP